MHFGKGLFLASIAWAIGLPTAPARAADQPLLLGGTQWSPNSTYSYLGAILPLAPGTLGQGFFQRYWVDYLTYHYSGPSALGIIQATSPGVQVALGYQWSGTGYYAALSLGGGYRYVHLNPYDATATIKGNIWSLIPEFEAGYDFTPYLQGNLIASYAFGPRQYWGRLRLGWRPDRLFRVGPEVILQGNPDYDAQQAGLFVGTDLGGGWGMEVDGGVQFSRNLARTGYAGLALSKSF